MTFEKYPNAKTTRTGGIPCASIHKTGLMYPAGEAQGWVRPFGWVNVYWNAKAREIKLELGTERELESLRVRQTTSGFCNIEMSGFCVHFGIPIPQLKRPVKKINDHTLIISDIKL